MREPAPDERRPHREAAAAAARRRRGARAEERGAPSTSPRAGDYVDCADLRPLRAAGAARASPGPAIIEEFDSTTVVHPGFTVSVDEVGNLIIEREGQRERAVRHRRLEGRDGRRCGTGSALRPTCTGPRATASPSPAASRRSSASRRTTRPSGATRRSPTSSSRTATRSSSRTCATGTARRARRSTSTARRRTPARDGYDTIEWIAAQPFPGTSHSQRSSLDLVQREQRHRHA